MQGYSLLFFALMHKNKNKAYNFLNKNCPNEKNGIVIIITKL